MPRFVEAQSHAMELCKQRAQNIWVHFPNTLFLSLTDFPCVPKCSGSGIHWHIGQIYWGVWIGRAFLFNWSFDSVVFVEFLESKSTAMVLNASCIRSPRGLVVMHLRANVGMDQWQAAVCPLSGGQTRNTQLSFRSFSPVTFGKLFPV